MTSVYKAMDVSVTAAIKAAQDGSFSNEAYVGTLKNQGTGISPYHEFDAKIPAELKAEVEKVKADIESGSLKVTSKSAP
jgi:basic membrane protein A